MSAVMFTYVPAVPLILDGLRKTVAAGIVAAAKVGDMNGALNAKRSSTATSIFTISDLVFFN
jgi:hypothetical protein